MGASLAESTVIFLTSPRRLSDDSEQSESKARQSESKAEHIRQSESRAKLFELQMQAAGHRKNRGTVKRKPAMKISGTPGKDWAKR